MFLDDASGQAGPTDCTDPIESLRTMFVDLVQAKRIAAGQSPAMRPVFLKPHGVARATLTVAPDLPDDLRVGVFAGSEYAAWVRFSSDTVPTNPDLKTTVGIGIKLFGVPGPKLLAPDEDAPTQDFLLQNMDVFFVDTAADMCAFTRAGVVEHDYDSYLAAHPTTAAILDEMKKVVPSVLTTPYWSGLPYRFGKDRYVKYKLAPLSAAAPARPADENDPYYLHADLRARLLAGEASFALQVQLRTDPDTMPLDAATVRWDESASPPVTVATLTLASQDVDARGQAAYGENLAYNPWHSLAEHEPVGSISDARKVVYRESANLRRDTNGVPLAEPETPRPEMANVAAKDTVVVRAAICPALGVARVGDSQEEFFHGPEVPDPEPMPEGSYKDATGAMKRQAARFRLYGYNAAGEVVGELTSDDAAIDWTVHVANAKSSWYEFQIALDIPEAPAADPSLRRNAKVKDRASLTIDPGPRTISGANASGPEYAFDTGSFLGTPVYLGELRTDEAGRLVFLGGRGVSASADGSPPTTFANNEGWHDDTSDGPVTATVTIDGRSIPVDPAWVIVAPPNYAPQLKSVRTMHDLLVDAYVTAGSLPPPGRPSFTNDVLPILARICRLEWVNHGFATAYGWQGRSSFLDPDYLARLASPAPEHAELRNQVWTSFRDYLRDGESPVPLPWIYGDAMSLPPISPRQHVTVSPTQYALLDQWALGEFDADYDASYVPPSTIDAVPLAQQPETLTRAALDFCLADAFHPGCEITWPMRHTTMYAAPFRIRHRAPGAKVPDYGTQLTPTVATGVGGPLYAQGPGDLTRWMAVPWQTDTASCRSGYQDLMGFGPRYDPYVPTFWPARVPNHVLTEDDYDTVMDASRPMAERQAAFERRGTWLRFLPANYYAGITAMVTDFGRLGVVEVRPGPDDGAFPAELMVESEVGFPTEGVPLNRNLITVHVEDPAGESPQPAMLRAAAEATGFEEVEVSTGYIDLVRRFPRHLR
ncbi:MAG TPA: LodA/GoxA family CTQ-dependent oxidase [Frankiaceae bacterium]|jgi:hypothetical protein|nr:LodA/GoxA family CTQ-dependent oxidase [Frankiaceae bacterium]